MGNTEKKHILLITTGGTIASVLGGEGLEPRRSDVMERELNQLRTYYRITVQDLMCLDSSNIRPEEWVIIARAIFEARGTCDGIVVSHGTDTMAYTASMATFMLENIDLPVVFTGSQLPLADFLSDGPGNLRTAFAMAASGAPGVFLAFDRKIMLGCRSVKVRTTAFDAFESVNYPYAGVVDSSGLNLDRSVIPPQRGECVLEDTVDSDVYLLKLTPGTNPKLVDLMIEAGCHGIVIEAFGIGGLQFVRRDFVSKIEKAIDAGIPVVVCSQCLYERSDFSVYQVGQKALAKGAIQGFDMTREAAVTKLMWALGHTRDLGEIRAMFHTNLAGEIAL